MDKNKKKYNIKKTKYFQEQYKKLPLEQQSEVDKIIQGIAKDPYKGEPSKPCLNCGKYFFYSDGKCPFCGFKNE